MREEPAPELVALLARLRLATPDRVMAASPQARRLARGLPLFASVWVDALARGGVLTPFQASEINAGRGELLGVGPYVLVRPLAESLLGATFEAVQIKSQARARLLVVAVTEADAGELAKKCSALIEATHLVTAPEIAVVEAAGVDNGKLWAACRYEPAVSARQWMIERGRMPAADVLHVARAMARGLAELDRLEVVHGDLCAAGLLLPHGGGVVLPWPGVRGILRPSEGYTRANLQPAAYDYLAPERIEDGSPPTTASDVYACGAVLWNLAAGRPPFAGGNSLQKLRAVHEARLPTLEHLVPDAPPVLLAAIAACLAKKPSERPAGFEELAALLGPDDGAAARRYAARAIPSPAEPHIRSRTRVTTRLAAAAALIAVVAAAAYFAEPLRSWLAGTELDRPVRTQNTAAVPATPRAEADKRPVASRPAVDAERRATRASATTVVEPLLLPTDRLVRLARLYARRGQTVRGENSLRAQLLVSGRGIVVSSENVRFENVDFFWTRGRETTEPNEELAIVQLAALRAEFHGCSFQSLDGSDRPPAAILWSQPTGAARSGSGDLLLADCALRHVSAAVDCRLGGAATVELAGVLQVDAGPLLSLPRWPTSSATVSLFLDRVTLRQSGGVLECAAPSAAEAPGLVEVAARDCVFAPSDGRALVTIAGEDPRALVSASLKWSGQSSLLAADCTLLAWRDARGRLREIDESHVEVAGLARGKFEFADAPSPVAASRLIRWQAPTNSPEPPGVNTGTIDLPERPKR